MRKIVGYQYQYFCPTLSLETISWVSSVHRTVSFIPQIFARKHLDISSSTPLTIEMQKGIRLNEVSVHVHRPQILDGGLSNLNQKA